MSTDNTTKTKLSAKDVLADYDQLILIKMQAYIGTQVTTPYASSTIAEIRNTRSLLQNLRNTETGSD